MKKKPDNVVFNEKTSEFDAKNKLYPTNVGAPSFKPVVIDNTSSIKATKYFKTKLSEIEKDYKKLLDDYTDKLMKRILDEAEQIAQDAKLTFETFCKSLDSSENK